MATASEPSSEILKICHRLTKAFVGDARVAAGERWRPGAARICPDAVKRQNEERDVESDSEQPPDREKALLDRKLAPQISVNQHCNGPRFWVKEESRGSDLVVCVTPVARVQLTHIGRILTL